MRYKTAGNNTVALSATTVASGQNLMGQNMSGRNFWLKGVHVWAASGGCQMALYDATAGTAHAAANNVLTFNAASGAETILQFSEPGLKFSTGVCVCKNLTDPSSAFAIGSCGGWGYEE